MDLKALIETLAQRTQARGCTEAEEDAAARKIGKLIMKHGLAGGFSPQTAFDSTIYQPHSTINENEYAQRIAELLRRASETRARQQRTSPFGDPNSPFFRWTT